MLLGQFLEPPAEIHCVADDGEFHSLRRSDVADNNFAIVDACSHPKFRPPACPPGRVQLNQSSSHRHGGTNRGNSIFPGAVAVESSPNRHESVTDELVQSAAVLEDAL